MNTEQLLELAKPVIKDLARQDPFLAASIARTLDPSRLIPSKPPDIAQLGRATEGQIDYRIVAAPTLETLVADFLSEADKLRPATLRLMSPEAERLQVETSAGRMGYMLWAAEYVYGYAPLQMRISLSRARHATDALGISLVEAVQGEVISRDQQFSMKPIRQETD